MCTVWIVYVHSSLSINYRHVRGYVIYIVQTEVKFNNQLLVGIVNDSNKHSNGRTNVLSHYCSTQIILAFLCI